MRVMGLAAPRPVVGSTVPIQVRHGQDTGLDLVALAVCTRDQQDYTKADRPINRCAVILARIEQTGLSGVAVYCAAHAVIS